MAMVGPRHYADVHGSSAPPQSHSPSHSHWHHSKEHFAVLSVAGDIRATVTSMLLPGSPTLPVVMDRNCSHMAGPNTCCHSSDSGIGAANGVSGSNGGKPIYNMWSIHLELPPQATAVGLDFVQKPSSLDLKEAEHLRFQLARQLHESLNEPVAQWFSTAAGLPPPVTTAACLTLDVASPTAAAAAVVTASDCMSDAANPFASVNTASISTCASSSNSAASPEDEAAPDLAALLVQTAEAPTAAALTVAPSATPHTLAPPVAPSHTSSLCPSGQNHSTDCCVLPQLQLAQCMANAMAPQHLSSDLSVVKYPIQRSLSPTRKRHLAGGSQGSGGDHDSAGSCGGFSGAGYASTGSTCGSAVANTAVDVESQRRALADGRFAKSSSSLPLTSSSRGSGIHFQGLLGPRASVGSVSSHPSSAGKPPRPPRRGEWAAGRLAGASAGVGAAGLGGRNGSGGVMSLALGQKERQGAAGARRDSAWTTVLLALILAGLLAVLLLLTRH